MKKIRLILVVLLVISAGMITNVENAAAAEEEKKEELSIAEKTEKEKSKIIDDIRKLNPKDLGEGIRPLIDKAMKLQEKKTKAEAGKESEKKFYGMNWGPGLAFVSISGKSIEKAEIIDGVIRITEERSRQASLMLETHYFTSFFKEQNFAVGPFAAIKVVDEENNTLGAYGAGIMFGARRDPGTTVSSWNIGIGYYVDTDVKELRSGHVEGQALPGTETEIQFKDVDKSGWMIMVSSNFF